MLKTGVYSVEQIDKLLDNGQLNAINKNFAITLYDQIIEHHNSDAIAERILLLFTDERGAYKRTYSKRFESFDDLTLAHMQENLQGADAALIHDVGVSDARTSVDLFSRLTEIFPKLKFYASDYSPLVYVLANGTLQVILSANKKLLQIVKPPFVFNKIKRDSYRHEPINHIVRFLLEHLSVKKLLQRYNAGVEKAKEYYLFAPQALRLAKRDPRFILQQHDILQPLPMQYNFIRAMNVLNDSYFTADEFKVVIENVYNGLLLNGLLIVGSNQDSGSEVNGSIYKKTMVGFERVAQSGQGTQIDNLILGYRKN